MGMNGDNFLEVYSWLSAKTLHKFASVAKSCSDFLSETYFMERQCLHSMHKTEESLFIDEDSGLSHMSDNLLFQTFLETQHVTVGLPYESLVFLAKKARILASSNGLLLCKTVNGLGPTELFLCNPATRAWISIGLPIEDFDKYDRELNVVLVCGGDNFGNNKFPWDYSILYFELDSSREWSNYFKVYMYEVGQWVFKTDAFYTGGRELDFRHPVHCNSSIYFMSDCGGYLSPRSLFYWPYIVCYNVNQGTTEKIALPEETLRDFEYCTMNIFGWEASGEEGKSGFKSLSLVKSREGNPTFSIWVLEDPNSWHKLLDIDIVNDLEIKDSYSSSTSCAIVGKKLVFATNNCVYSYGLEGNDYGKLQKICENNCEGSTLRFNTYCSTLRPCWKDTSRSSFQIK